MQTVSVERLDGSVHVIEKCPQQAQINAIRKGIHKADKELFAKYPWLKYQDQIGAAWFFFSCGIIASCIAGYALGYMSLIWAIPLCAFAGSILHELEHDLIHNLYFAKFPWFQDVCFAVIWFVKASANPWWRRTFHLKHHKVSGQATDVEERFIGLGLPMGIKRWLLWISPLATPIVAFDIAADCKKYNSKPFLHVVGAYAVNLPVMLPAHIMAVMMFFPQYLPEYVNTFVWYYTMFFFVPNLFRQFCLQVISTSCHYYGDIPEKNVFFQNQVLNHWICYPLQLFCFNFGETHIMHHFVTRQTFYVRQLCSPSVLKVMKENGIRFNDMKILERANRYYDSNENAQLAN